ncbi:MAG: hypothetical protein AVDCRST_MAG32-1201 [uncultured Nocardioides sp.]|uniref:Uncharacterized protein n=1 Tax=uncultured Nocardioides sp. TaxID=198441 RepID=A0A6J4N2M7_9ACTN|nr:MAG: hypothetical protein AVDCRST_MAG32-1201 [uncultured Nocardioides sp.]
MVVACTLAVALVLALIVLGVWQDDDGPALEPLDSRGDHGPVLPLPGAERSGVGPLPGDLADPPRTLSFGAAEVVHMPIGEDAWAPVAIRVHAIRRGDAAAVDQARPRGLAKPRRVYYADMTLTFEGLGVIDVTPFLTLAQGSRELNIHHAPLALYRPFPPCPSTSDGVTLPAGEPVDVCVVFPGPRPERVRGVSLLGEAGVPTWEGVVS